MGGARGGCYAAPAGDGYYDLPAKGVTGVVAADVSPAVTAPADADLHCRVVAGDDHALAEVYERFGAFVYALARRVTGDADAARDIVQEVFVHFWERPLSYDPERAGLRTWFATLAHRRSVDWVRREERRRRLPAAQAALSLAADTQPTAAEQYEAACTAARVRQIVADLPDLLRQPVELAFYGGLTYREVAVELRIPEGTAKSRMRSALQQLRRILAAEGLGR
jgi:RNA polymerase sigma-70 factor (ECF subfamily)